MEEWSEEKCLQLIRAYKSKRILWDPKEPLFFKNSLKPIAWLEISELFGLTADQCKHKMVILMSSFRREKAKIMNSKKNNTEFKSMWFAFKEMAFLLDKASERKRQLNESTEDAEEEDDSGNIKIADYYIEAPPRQPKKAKTTISVNKTITQRPIQVEREETTPPVKPPTPGPSQTPFERDEEIKSFTTFIGNKMKKYSDKTKNSVQQAICEIIFKADQNNFEGEYYEKFKDPVADVDDNDPLIKQMGDESPTIIKLESYSDSDD